MIKTKVAKKANLFCELADKIQNQECQNGHAVKSVKKAVKHGAMALLAGAIVTGAKTVFKALHIIQ